MLTKLICRNFKNFGEVEVELGNLVVFIGPNNSGKTTALQALALWEIGLRRWNENRRGKTNPEKLPGVAINRFDLISVPVPSTRLLWRDLKIRDVERIEGKQRTQNVRIDIIVEGVTDGKGWQCGFEFDYANQESFYCRPLRTSEENGKVSARMPVPDEAEKLSVAFLIPDELQKRPELMEYAWQKREIENYIVSSKQVLIDWLQAKAEERTEGPLFSMNSVSIMEKKIEEIEKARETLGQESPWSPDIKVTDEFLDRLFETVFDELKIPNLMQKTNYHTLVQYVSSDHIDPEVTKVLDSILEVANKAVPLSSV